MAVPRRERWAVLGGSGFVGRSILTALGTRDIDATAVQAPRLHLSAETDAAAVVASARRHQEHVQALTTQLHEADVVVNAAGLATPGGTTNSSLTGANALLPVVAFEAARTAGARLFLHVSSAAVQGRRPVLDETEQTAPLSPYARSKALGEQALLQAAAEVGTCELVIIRATSVQGAGRQTTANLQRLARSPMASVASPGNQPTIVSSAEGLGTFAVSVGTAADGERALIVLQPWEGVTVGDVLRAAGGRAPRVLPRWVCRSVLGLGYAVARMRPSMVGGVRRVEVLWFGQRQEAAWARDRGLDPAPPAVLRVLAGVDGGAFS